MTGFSERLMSALPTTRLLTAEQFARLPDDDMRTELILGEVVRMNMPGFQHGFISTNIARHLGNHVQKRQLGRVIDNSGVITHRKPDSVRGPDVAFFSYERLPKSVKPKPYPNVAPELVFEVRSPDDRWPKLLAKVAEYLEAGVLMVCVVDPDSETIHVYAADEPVLVLKAGNRMTFPKWLGGWRVQVQKFFE